jgi:hypothetical protein
MKQTKTTRAIKWTGRILAVFFFTPILMTVFFFDRFILLFLFWMYSPNMKEWSQNGDFQFYSLLRCGVAVLIFAIYVFFKFVVGSGSY